MRDVRGYEEKDPATLEQLQSGYPRFVVHPLVRRLTDHLVTANSNLAGRTLWLTTSGQMAGLLAAHLRAAGDATLFSQDGLHGVSHSTVPDLQNRAKTFLQNIGGFLGSREAEDHLVRLRLIEAVHPEESFQGDALEKISSVLCEVLSGTSRQDLAFAPSGMNAIYAAFRACADLQASRGRTVWLQLGWLYLDTIAILKKFTATPADYVYVRDPLDVEGIERIFAQHGSRLAGAFVELPTNPLIQTPDLLRLAGLCRQHGVKLIVDPSIASVFNVDVLPHCDVVAASLTKYAGSGGDLLAGFCVVNPQVPEAAELRGRIAEVIEPVYARDLGRLAMHIGVVDSVLDSIHRNTARVVSFLKSHSGVREVFWALHPASRENYLRVARKPGATGGMITFTLKGDLTRFYDRLRLPKGPSFGMTTTLICPFMYLAHYDLVTTPAGLAELSASKLNPDLLRLCCGTEPAEEIISALAEALEMS